MDNFISILRDSNSPAELEELKVQLFRENVRIKTDKADLEELKETIAREKKELVRLIALYENGLKARKENNNENQ